ncbi:MAG: Uma2 family endonuclease [Anaerolineae bacterium]
MTVLSRVEVAERMTSEEFFRYAPEDQKAELIDKERLDIIQREGVFGAPDLVIEILSAGTVTYDRGPKFRAYERAGVRELWLIDPYGPAGTEFYHLQGNRFIPVMPDEKGILRSVAVAGFWIDVAWLWPDELFIPVRQALAQIAAN